jgi:hypothetical protein
VVSLFRGKGAVASKGNKRAVQAALSGDACTVLGMGNSMLRRALGDVLVQLVGKEDEEVSSQVVSWLEGDDWGVREAVGLVLARICGKGDAGAQRAVIEKVGRFTSIHSNIHVNFAPRSPPRHSRTNGRDQRRVDSHFP